MGVKTFHYRITGYDKKGNIVKEETRATQAVRFRTVAYKAMNLLTGGWAHGLGNEKDFNTVAILMTRAPKPKKGGE